MQRCQGKFSCLTLLEPQVSNIYVSYINDGILIHVWPQHYFSLLLLMNNNILKLDNGLSLGFSNIEYRPLSPLPQLCDISFHVCIFLVFTAPWFMTHFLNEPCKQIPLDSRQLLSQLQPLRTLILPVCLLKVARLQICFFFL